LLESGQEPFCLIQKIAFKNYLIPWHRQFLKADPANGRFMA
jgi:hypothetical protein